MNNTVQIFIDPPADMPAKYADLFRDFGLEAYGIIFAMEAQEQERDEQEAWDRVKPLRDDYEEESDEEIDYGFEEPDDY